MSLNVSCRNCKLYLLPGVKYICLRREHKDSGELVMMGWRGAVRGEQGGSTVRKGQEVEPGPGGAGGRSGYHFHALAIYHDHHVFPGTARHSTSLIDGVCR